MDIDSIKSLTRISRSLWGDLDRSVAISEDALTSVSLLQLSDERTLERASKVLIERAEKNPPKLLTLQHPFYRLAPLERFLLTALHIEKWPYSKICRTLSLDSNLLESWAWAIRMKFMFQELSTDLKYPRGPAKLGPMCPDYNASAPWTQRLLDDELTKRDRVFLQGHLVACEECRKSLELARKLFFKIESLIPVKDAFQETEAAAARIHSAWQAGESAFRPIKTTFTESMVVFLSKTQIQFTLAAFTLFIFYCIRKS